MLSSSVRSYADAEIYAKALPSATVDLHVLKGGAFSARTTLVTLHDLGIARFSDNLPRVAHAALRPGRTIVSFRTEPGPDLFWGGLEMLPNNILWHNEGSCSFQRSSGLAAWGSMSLPLEVAEQTLTMLAGRDLTSPRHPLSLVPSSMAMTKLQRLHAACGVLAEKEPGLLANPDAARGLEQGLIEALADCFGSMDGPDENAAQRRHASVMARLRAIMEANPDRPLYMPEVSAALGVSGRTLRDCCKEHLGMGAT